MEMNLLIEKFCNECGYDIYSNYSGRYMHGKNCIGIITDEPSTMMVHLAEFLVKEGICNVADALGSICQDEMGLSKIVYFPQIQF